MIPDLILIWFCNEFYRGCGRNKFVIEYQLPCFITFGDKFTRLILQSPFYEGVIRSSTGAFTDKFSILKKFNLLNVGKTLYGY